SSSSARILKNYLQRWTRFERGRGLLAPCTPAAGALPLHPMREVVARGNELFPREAWGTKRCVPTGAMKTIKTAEGKFIFPPLIFSFSPDAFSIRPAAFRRPARGAAVPHPTRKVSIVLLQRGFCVARSAGTQFAKTHSFSAKVCVHVTLFHRDIACNIQIASSGEWVQGQ
ncbi:MAG: hypothetical protein IKJ51_11770, partial [Clostridia bacterium]|nr:hypothetical protein [Clostridia bacterium]